MADMPAFPERRPEGGSWGGTLGRLISWAGGHAMRPQAAMAAVLLLMIGSSVFFLRARPEQSSPSRVNVIERGVPGHRDELTPPPPTLATAELRLAQEHAHGSAGASTPSTASRREPSKAPAAKESDNYAAAVALYEEGEYAAAVRKLDGIAETNGENAASAALLAARGVQAESGCEKALPRYEAVASRFANGEVAGEALLAAAACHESLGNRDKAREIYVALRRNPATSDRAERALDSLDAQAASPPAEVTPPETPPSASP